MEAVRVIVLAVLACCAGCVRAPRAAAGIVDGRPSVTQRGDIQVPAAAHVKTTGWLLPIPAGSTIAVRRDAPAFTLPRQVTRDTAGVGDARGVTPGRDVPGGADAWQVTLAGDSAMRGEVREESAVGAQTYAPPPPPSPSDKTDAWALLAYRIGLVVGVAAFAFGLVRGWDLVAWGGAAVAAACLFALFVQRHPALFGVIGGGIALAAGGVWIWHSRLKKITTPAA